MICFGVVNAICSIIFGTIMKYTGRIPIILLGMVVHGSIIIVLMFWRPSPEQPMVFFLISGLYGVGDAVWQTQINGEWTRTAVAATQQINNINIPILSHRGPYRNLRSPVQTKQGSCILQLSPVGVGWLRDCLRLFDHAVCPDEALRPVLRSGTGHPRLDHRRSATPAKGTCSALGTISHKTNPSSILLLQEARLRAIEQNRKSPTPDPRIATVPETDDEHDELEEDIVVTHL